MYILGISGYAHESSAALIKDGAVRVILEEERLNREKHTWKYPQHAIEQCLAREGITMRDIDAVTFFWDPAKEIFGNAMHFLKYFPRSIHLLAAPSGSDKLSFARRIMAMRRVGVRIQEQFGLAAAPKVTYVEHHVAHAASAFFVSGFSDAAILTIDGRGESTATMLSVGHGSTIEKIKEISVPHSLGHLYAAVTDYLGFRPFFDEWKVMGMSAYGTDAMVELFEDVVRLEPDGGYRLHLPYFDFHVRGRSKWLSDHFLKTFGPARATDDPYEQRHFDVARALQRTIERAGVHVAQHLARVTKLPNLCMTGGVILNCLMNREIINRTPFEHFFIQPIANDAGTSLGSALYYYHGIRKQERNFVFDTVYWGPEFSDADIERVLKANGVRYEKVAHIEHEAARAIAEGKIVGWFQGRMEAGPRALGNRSIVVDPRDAGMKQRLNERVKKREFFRPFAPSVLAERAAEYFAMPKGQPSPYMILVGDVREEKRSVIPAVTHADNTARVHTVDQRANPRYWKLISEFERLSGVPVVLNTSFNENEPIVCTPEDAVRCFLRTEFDVLAIGDYLVVKS